MPSAAAGQGLPAADDRIDIGGVELQPVAAPAGALGGDHRRATADKAVEYDVAARRAIEDRIGDHRDRLHRRVQRREIALSAAAGEGVGPRVAPYVAAVAPEPAKLDVVAVPGAAVFEHEDKLVLAAVERTHAAIVLDPNTEVFQLAINAATGGQEFFGMAPIHANEVDRAGNAECY